jgi:hypothetical protein
MEMDPLLKAIQDHEKQSLLKEEKRIKRKRAMMTRVKGGKKKPLRKRYQWQSEMIVLRDDAKAGRIYMLMNDGLRAGIMFDDIRWIVGDLIFNRATVYRRRVELEMADLLYDALVMGISPKMLITILRQLENDTPH